MYGKTVSMLGVSHCIQLFSKIVYIIMSFFIDK